MFDLLYFLFHFILIPIIRYLIYLIGVKCYNDFIFLDKASWRLGIKDVKADKLD